MNLRPVLIGLSLAGITWILFGRDKRGRPATQAEKNEWKASNQPLGDSLGYPPCCVAQFCQDDPVSLKNRRITDDDKARYQASLINGVFSGFIPCSRHAAEILEGKTTLHDLIQNRSRELPPFPEYARYSVIDTNNARKR